MAGMSFNPHEHDTTQRDYEELPNGTYRLEVEASDVTKTNDGKGLILKTTMTVIEPAEFAGRKIFNNYNIENSSAQAQEIGQKQLSSLCRAIWGADAPSHLEDSEHLHFNAFTVKVGLGRPSKDGQYPARAEIKKYFFPDEGDLPDAEIDAVQPTKPTAANDNRPASRAPAGQQQAAAAGKPAGARPWGAKK